jgi:hypothetical protein
MWFAFIIFNNLQLKLIFSIFLFSRKISFKTLHPSS